MNATATACTFSHAERERIRRHICPLYETGRAEEIGKIADNIERLGDLEFAAAVRACAEGAHRHREEAAALAAMG